MNKYFDTKTKGEQAVVIAMIIGAIITLIIATLMPEVMVQLMIIILTIMFVLVLASYFLLAYFMDKQDQTKSPTSNAITDKGGNQIKIHLNNSTRKDKLK